MDLITKINSYNNRIVCMIKSIHYYINISFFKKKMYDNNKREKKKRLKKKRIFYYKNRILWNKLQLRIQLQNI